MSPWVILGLVIMGLASVASVGLWQNRVGHTAERAIWQEKESKELAQAAVDIKAAEDKARDVEQQWSKKMSDASLTYQKELKNAKAKFKPVDTSVDNGTFRLLDSRAETVCPSASPGPQATATPAGHNGAEGCKLSAEASRFLWQLATDADTNTQQLAACQQVIIKERE